MPQRPPFRDFTCPKQIYSFPSALTVLLFPSHCRSAHPYYSSSLLPMSQTLSTSTSSSNFQSIFYTAVKAYEKKTKNDLLTHPLVAQLQACSSASDILVVLQDKVKEFDQSRSADERLSQWLNPTINVLYAFSATLGGGVGLVSPIHSTCQYSPL